MNIDFREQQFVLSEVLHAINAGGEKLDTKTARNWITLGYLPRLSKQAPGTGKRVMYSALDTVMMAALYHMTAIGMSPKTASVVLHLFRDAVKEREEAGSRNLREEFGDARLYLYFDPGKDDIQITRVRDKAPQAPRAKKRPAYVMVNQDEIIDGVVGELKKILAEQEATA